MERLVLAVDLGGTQIRGALVDAQGRLSARTSTLTQAQEGVQRVLGRVVDVIGCLRGKAKGEDPEAIGVGAPGPLDPWRGLIRSTPNLPGWRDVPLRDILAEEFGLPVYLGNDANLAALAEHRFGAGKGSANLVYLTISTGIGGGVVSEGQLVHGRHGLASEPGHMVLEREGPRCGCGKKGCLEALASGTAIAREAREALMAGRPSLIAELAGGEVHRVDARLVAEAAQRGDALAQEIYQRAGFYIGLGIVNLMHLFNPEVVVLGGGVSRAGDLLLAPIREVVAERALASFQEDFSIVLSGLGDDAGLLGAAAWASSRPAQEESGLHWPRQRPEPQ